MTNLEVQNNYENLVTIRNDKTLCFPTVVAYAIARNLRTLQPIYEDIMNERYQLAQKYGLPIDDNPGSFRIKEENMEIFSRQLEELNAYNTSVEVNKIPLRSLGDMQLSISDMDALYFMVEE